MQTVCLSDKDMQLIRGALVKLEIGFMNMKEQAVKDGCQEAEAAYEEREKRCAYLRTIMKG